MTDHGTIARYQEACRCAECRRAHWLSRRGPNTGPLLSEERRAKNDRAKTDPVTTAPHGTLTRYTRGRCRCDDCRKVMADYARARRQRRKEARAMSNANRWKGGRCVNGHDITDPSNVYVAPGNGQRYCVVCRRDTQRRDQADLKALRAARRAEQEVA